MLTSGCIFERCTIGLAVVRVVSCYEVGFYLFFAVYFGPKVGIGGVGIDVAAGQFCVLISKRVRRNEQATEAFVLASLQDVLKFVEYISLAFCFLNAADDVLVFLIMAWAS